MTKKQKINRCKDCAMSRQSPFWSKYCSCPHQAPGMIFPKMSKACEHFQARQEKNND